MLFQATSKFLLGLSGWSSRAFPPDAEGYVLVGAHHTSNWDFPLAIIGMRAMGIPFHWVAKHTLFFWPMGCLMRFLGGVSVDRAATHGFVSSAVALFATDQHMVLAIAPDGTRSKTAYWKTGFYQIALKAQVPIAFGYVDYKNRTIGIAEGILPTGDIENDMQIIRGFYKHRHGKYPDRESEIALRGEKHRPEP